jgi:salicylate hydroxylase
VPATEARQTLSAHRVSTRFMYNGPDAHAITYPVADGALLNVLLVLSDPAPWTEPRHTARGSKAEALAAFGAWHPTARAIVDLLPDEMEKWAIFDMHDHPAPAYHGAGGRVCIAGDAAHAVGPHLGAGAGFGMEDALVLVELMDVIDRAAAADAATTPVVDGGNGGTKNEEKAAKKAELCRKAMAAYNDVRYERTQWLAGRTREAVDLFQQNYDGVGDNFEKFGDEITWRFHQIWEYDVDQMVRTALETLNIRQ